MRWSCSYITRHSSSPPAPGNGSPAAPSIFGKPSASNSSPGAMSLTISGGGWPNLTWYDRTENRLGNDMIDCVNDSRNSLLNLLHVQHQFLDILWFGVISTHKLPKAFVLLATSAQKREKEWESSFVIVLEAWNNLWNLLVIFFLRQFPFVFFQPSRKFLCDLFHGFVHEILC